MADMMAGLTVRRDARRLVMDSSLGKTVMEMAVSGGGCRWSSGKKIGVGCRLQVEGGEG
jgi:hypothetical protein